MISFMRIILILAIVIFLTACVPPTPHDYTWTAYKDGTAALEFEMGPGYLVSTGTFESEPVEHPFLSAKALVPDYEDEIRTLLEESNSFGDFASKLEENGYELKSRKRGTPAN